MAGKKIEEALNVAYTYLTHRFGPEEAEGLCRDLLLLSGCKKHDFKLVTSERNLAYDNVQNIMSGLNEKESIRKSKGVYYTPTDVVKFILYNAFRGAAGQIESGNLHRADLDGLPYGSLCFEKTVFDPTCGAGEFLLHCLDMKFDLLEANVKDVTSDMIGEVVGTLHGNDVNKESTAISKIRLYLCCVHRYGPERVTGVSEVLCGAFRNYDFVMKAKGKKDTYDIIVGNPPYVEDAKSGLNPEVKYGNIYANVLENAAKMLGKDGVFGFIIPLSYVSTPRMEKIRKSLTKLVPEQYILSYSDRPDCLFTSVHQKLNILIGVKKDAEPKVFTGNYQYWYKENREDLFRTTEVVENRFAKKEFIPKLGNALDCSIYQKVTGASGRVSFADMKKSGGGNVYLNMRAAFWIKAFLNEHAGSEYKTLTFEHEGMGCYAMCLLNSSLFWWYWVCISDCWHITQKEFANFFVPQLDDFAEVTRLAQCLETELEETKVYVGTKQVEYEYKHRDCVEVIHRVDDYINRLFGLTEDESNYIKNFAYRYRISGGANSRHVEESN